MSPSIKKKAAAKKTAGKKLTGKSMAGKKTAKKKTAKKKSAKKISVTKKAAKKKITAAGKASVKRTGKTGVKSPVTDALPNSINLEERWNMIAVAAYHKAEKRGFVPGYELQDWAEAEKEIAELLPLS
jgi:Protein of unknown function (DUF2934)